MQRRKSIFQILGLPNAFVTTLLLIFFLIILSPYLGGMIIGSYHIPIIPSELNNPVKFFGPPCFFVLIIFCIPIILVTPPDKKELSLPHKEAPTKTLFLRSAEGELLVVIGRFERLDSNAIDPSYQLYSSLKNHFQDIFTKIRVEICPFVLTQTGIHDVFDFYDATLIVSGSAYTTDNDLIVNTLFHSSSKFIDHYLQSLAASRSILSTPLTSSSFDVSSLKTSITKLNDVALYALSIVLFLDKSYLDSLSLLNRMKLEHFADQEKSDILQKKFTNLFRIGTMGFNNHNTDDIVKAKRYLDDAYALSPNSFKILSNLGAVHSVLGDRTEAALFYQKALEVNPNDINTIINIAILEIRNGNQDSALALLTEANELINKYDKDPEVNLIKTIIYTNISSLLLQKSEVDSAILWLKKTLEIDPENLATLINLGIAYTRLQLWSNADKVYETAFRIDKNNPSLFVNWALSFCARDDIFKAINKLQEAITYHSDNMNLHIFLGALFFKENDEIKSKQYLSKAKDLFLAQYKTGDYCGAVLNYFPGDDRFVDFVKTNFSD